jgi:hypothetical protein
MAGDGDAPVSASNPGSRFPADDRMLVRRGFINSKSYGFLHATPFPETAKSRCPRPWPRRCWFTAVSDFSPDVDTRR